MTGSQQGILWRSQACAMQVNAFRGDADRAIVESDSAFQARVNAAPRPSSRQALRSPCCMSALKAKAALIMCMRTVRGHRASYSACLGTTARKDGVLARPKAQPARIGDSVRLQVRVVVRKGRQSPTRSPQAVALLQLACLQGPRPGLSLTFPDCASVGCRCCVDARAYTQYVGLPLLPCTDEHRSLLLSLWVACTQELLGRLMSAQHMLRKTPRVKTSSSSVTCWPAGLLLQWRSHECCSDQGLHQQSSQSW